MIDGSRQKPIQRDCDVQPLVRTAPISHVIAGARFRSPRVRYVVLCTALALLAMLLPNDANRVQAQTLHAVLIHSQPAEGSVLTQPPSQIQLWFTEPVQLIGSSLTVFDPTGGPAEQGRVEEHDGRVSVTLHITMTGSYLVVWQIISQDTDPVSGSFVFSIGHVGGSWAGTTSSSTATLGVWLQLLAHLLHFLGYALSFGSLALLRLMLHPLARRHREALHKPIGQLVNLGIAILLLAEVVALIAQLVSLREHSFLDLAFLGTILSSSFGRVLSLRLGVALALWVLMGIVQQGNTRAVTATLLLGGALAIIDSTASHAISAPVSWLAIVATTLHILAMGIWIGGLIALLTLWGRADMRGMRRELVARFAPLALAAATELVLTGIVLAGLHLASPTDLFATLYGRILAIKVLAIVLPLFFALLSQRIYRNTQARWWRLEAAALLVILTLAAALAALPPPR